MDLLMDGLLAAAALFAGGYCWVLARRVRDLQALDKGLGGSIVTLTRQVELARGTLEEARGAARDSKHELGQLIGRAETAAAQLRLLIAAVGEPEPVRASAPAAPVASAPAPAPAAPPKLTVALPAEPARPAAVALAEVPKPRPLPPLRGLLRKRTPAAGPADSEEDLIEALSALAGGER